MTVRLDSTFACQFGTPTLLFPNTPVNLTGRPETGPSSLFERSGHAPGEGLSVACYAPETGLTLKPLCPSEGFSVAA